MKKEQPAFDIRYGKCDCLCRAWIKTHDKYGRILDILNHTGYIINSHFDNPQWASIINILIYHYQQ